MKREGYWLLAIIVLVGLSGWAVWKHHAKFGLDIDGGVRAVLQAHPKKGQAYDQTTVEQILEKRLNSTGVASTSVQSKPPDQFIIEIPNVRNQDAIVQQLQTTAQLEFRWYRDVSYSNSGRGQTSRYVMLPATKDAQGYDVVTFLDRQTNRTFHDQAYILKQFQAIIKDAAQRPGATAYPIPAPLNQFASEEQTYYFTPDQQKTVLELNQELQDFQTLNSDAESPLIMTGNDIESNAHAQIDPQKNEAVVELTCNATGTEKQAHFSSAHNEQTDPNGDNLMAIILDGNVLDVPVVQEPLLDGTSEISGGFTNLNEAQSLANLLNAGALPVPLTIVETESVEPTLGAKSLTAMEKAGIIGGIAVLIFMAAYYLLPGLLADVALLIYTLFALAVFNGGLSWIFPQVTLTLPGIAGFILSVGMAVDANILIFERLKEELRNGKALRPAIDAGFKRAFTAIRDSNICTLITCFILGILGTPEVQGFALTLGIGVALSLFTAITVTRTFLYLLVDAGVGNNPVLFGLKRQWGLSTQGAQYQGVRGEGTPQPVDVIGKRRFFYGLSLLIIIPGIIFWSLGGLKRSIEFTGGTQVEAVFTSPVTEEAVERALVSHGYKDNLVQMASGGTVAFASVKDRDPQAYLSVEKALDSVGTSYKLQSHSLVGGVISAELTSNAFEAVILASLLIILYLSIAFGLAGGGSGLSISGAMALNMGLRAAVIIAVAAAIALGKIHGWHYSAETILLGVFGTAIGCGLLFTIGWLVAGFRFGISAIVALLHDVLVLIGSFAILGFFLNWQIDSMFIVATLTVVGFSVHDTIVIFDRLRENLRHRLRGEEFGSLANRSILQSFARSINTSFTVILTLIAMMVFGEPSTRLLITALLIGIVSGTYSSIFNATPILVDWENVLARMRGMSSGVSLMPPMPPGASSGGGSTKPIRTAKVNGATRPLAERPSDDSETTASTEDRPSPRNKPKKRSQRRF